MTLKAERKERGREGWEKRGREKGIRKKQKSIAFGCLVPQKVTRSLKVIDSASAEDKDVLLLILVLKLSLLF